MEAHYMKADEDCMGRIQPGYWRCFATCSDGRSVIGTGPTEGDAIMNAKVRVDERENFLCMTDTDRLRILLDGDLLSTDSKEAIKIIGKLVLMFCERFGSEPR